MPDQYGDETGDEAADRSGAGAALGAAIVSPLVDRIAELEDVLIGAEIVIRMLAPTGQETTLETIRRALRRPN